MDRNKHPKPAEQTQTFVALRKESVDRNTSVVSSIGTMGVALRKESVDRNLHVCIVTGRLLQSLSARRAWIEIGVSLNYKEVFCVALRKESVDRNRLVVGSLITLGGSLSARRAWIEI